MKLAQRQHGAIALRQLRDLGFSSAQIRSKIEGGRLHPVMRGVYAVGRPELSARGSWMAAVLACGATAHLSHMTAAALWGLSIETTPRKTGTGSPLWEVESGAPIGRVGGFARGPIHVTVRAASGLRRPGIHVHRRPALSRRDFAVCDGIPVTTVVRTLLDLATTLSVSQIERAMNEADKLGLVSPETLRSSLEHYGGQPGVGRLRQLLDTRTFRLTDSELERRFLALVGNAGLPMPTTGQHVSGFKVDFYWAELSLVVETDGLTYHRTPAQQARDRVRDQAHTAAGLTQLRFTHAQVRFEAEQVAKTLQAVVRRLESSRAA